MLSYSGNRFIAPPGGHDALIDLGIGNSIPSHTAVVPTPLLPSASLLNFLCIFMSFCVCSSQRVGEVNREHGMGGRIVHISVQVLFSDSEQATPVLRASISPWSNRTARRSPRMLVAVECIVVKLGSWGQAGMGLHLSLELEASYFTSMNFIFLICKWG